MAQFDEFFIEFEKVLSLGLTLLFRDEDREDSGLNLRGEYIIRIHDYFFSLSAHTIKTVPQDQTFSKKRA